jgi:hypothetical protein
MAETFNERVAYWLRLQRMSPLAEIGVVPEEPNSLVPWQFLRVELKCLNPDGTADAYRLEWDEEEEEYAVDTSVSASELIKVRPFDGGSISGIGKDDVSEGQNGTRLWVIHPFDRGDNTPADDTWEPLVSAASTPSYGGFHVTSSGWVGPDWTTVTFATDFPATADITLNHAAGTITFGTAGTYMVHASLSIYGNTEEFEWLAGEAANWLLRVVKNPAGAATVVHVEESHLHGWTTGAGSDATGHCAFSVPVTVEADDVLVLQWQGPLDTGGSDRHGDAKYGALSVTKIPG